ncbi:hypothetical protein FA13DRAFT_1772446 [Coprinellus micaceus]|uniref:Extracellular membrane protein CFEM domain-containing protein n=1 Tax=Coprinellus micaceus TaxID=71717 RepID=A0A4Y7TK34_COPMI|nr:hypothetical protein FA13DRAFT_1772446 [Coprinellus micaceus]
MVNLRTGVILTSFVSLCLVTTPVLAQTMGGGEATDGQCEVCKTVASQLQTCDVDLSCLCSGDAIANYNACVSCVEGAGIDTSTVEQYDTIKGQPALCGGDATNVTTTSASSAATQSDSATTSTASTVSADTAPASTVSAPPPGRSNGAVALTGGVGALAAMAALVLGFAF